MKTHPSDLPNAIDRAVGHPEQQSVVFHGTRRFIQKGELNELQTIIRGRHDRLGRLVAKEGDRIERADAIVDHVTGKVTLLAGKIYVAGDIFPVAEAVLENVPMTGRVEIGVKLTRKWVTSEDDPELLGQEPGSLAEGEPWAACETISIACAIKDADNSRTESSQGRLPAGADAPPSRSANSDEFFPVYVLLDGTILDQKGPSLLEPAMQAIATYDRAHGHYVVNGCRVTALGADAGQQMFSIEEGEANTSGFKRTRKTALRYAEAEDWDEAAVPGETHTYPGGDRYTFAVDQYPIGVIRSILLTKEKTVSVTRGAVAAGQDGLPDNSVVSIMQVKQGSKIYVEGKDYIRTGNTVDWAPAGDEPAPGSSYEVTYRYRDSVTADEHNDREVTVSGGATGGDIIISYTYKMPRIDRIGLQTDGAPVYIKGISASANPMPPIVSEDVLSLATITNN